MKKGFTLLELLAVIVVLAIIALVVTPIITKAIDNTKKKACENSAYGVIKSAELYYANKLVNEDASATLINIVDGVDSNNPSFKYKGNRFQNAYIEINERGKIRMYAYSNGFCAKKDLHDSIVTVTKVDITDCSLDSLGQPQLTGGSSEWATSRTISVVSMPISTLTLDHFEYYISTSNITLIDGEWIPLEQGIDSVTIETNGEYYIYMRGIDIEDKNGDISVPQQVRIDTSDYPITVPGSITGGSVTADRLTAKVGEEITLTVVTSTGYELDNLAAKDINDSAITITENVILMPRNGVTVTAEFKKTTYEISLIHGANGSLSVSANPATMDSEVTITATPNQNYRLHSLTVTDIENNLITVTDNKFIMPESPVTIAATWEVSGIVINNKLNASIAKYRALTAGNGTYQWYVLYTLPTVANHKYFIYNEITYHNPQLASHLTNKIRITNPDSSNIDLISPPLMTMFQPTTAVQADIKHLYSGSTQAGYDSGVSVYLHMVVDVTPLEEATGQNYTATQFWDLIGAQVFYGDKTIEI